MNKLYYRIGDVARLVGVKPYVLRFWESEFPMIRPEKSPSGQRVYRQTDLETVKMIKHLLYIEKYSIEGARKRIQSLRKGGELKTFRKAVPEESQVSVEDVAQHRDGLNAGLRTEKIERLKQMTEELRELAKLPIARLFQL